MDKWLGGVCLITVCMLAQAAEPTIWNVDCRERDPYLYWRDNTCAGPVAELVAQAIAALGPEHKIRWRQAPWARTIKEAEEGGVDLVIMHSRNAERDQFLHTIEYGYEARRIFYYRNSSVPRDYHSFDEVKQAEVGALRGSFYSNEFNDALSEMHVHFVTSNEQLVQMLLLKRFDLAITSETHGIELFHEKPQLVPASYHEEYANSRCISIPRKSAKIDFAPRFDAIIAQMQQSGTIADIYSKYGLSISLSQP